MKNLTRKSAMGLGLLLCLVADTEQQQFDAQSFGLRAQKKFLSKVTSRKVISAFIDETSGRLLDNLYRLARDHSDKPTAEKVLINIAIIIIMMQP